MKSKLLIATVATVAAAGYATAGTVKLDVTPLSVSPGGAFKCTSLSGYNGETDSFGTFLTFCMEKNESFTAGQTMTAVINTQTVGASGNVPINTKTAYLYSNFRAGTLAGFSGSAADHGLLQDAIWMLQGQMAAAAPGVNQFYDLAQTSNWTDLGNVRVLNMFTYNNNGCQMRQDQLAIVPLPPAGWAGMATLAGLGIARRIRRAR